jgi:hypothetical protein
LRLAFIWFFIFVETLVNTSKEHLLKYLDRIIGSNDLVDVLVDAQINKRGKSVLSKTALDEITHNSSGEIEITIRVVPCGNK